jgi:putative transposase
MASKLRIHPPGVPLHFVQRGHNREPTFLDAEDCRCYLSWLHEGLIRWEVELHAYVLMTNHVHLLLTPGRAEGIACLMMSLGRRYVRYVNRKYARTGTLWEGRYRSSTIDSDAYLLACYRYIELNPVRAGLVLRPQDYEWSSYRSNGFGHPNPLLTPRAEFLAIGATASERLFAYRSLVADALQEQTLAEIRLATRLSRPLQTPTQGCNPGLESGL